MEEVSKAFTSKDGATQKLVKRVLRTKCYMNIKEEGALHCPEDRDTREWGGGWERAIRFHGGL